MADLLDNPTTPESPTPPAGRPVVVRFEQAVYGSFAFREDGYAMLAQSADCRPEWLADFRAACQKIGERPAGFAEAPALFSLRLASGPWAVVGVFPQGRDDRGRPGALGFHGLFVTVREFHRIAFDPFLLADRLQGEWTAETTALPAGQATVVVAPPEPAADGRAAAVVAALTRRRRVALESPAPIDDLARNVWRALPVRTRRLSSVATWTFGNGNVFDLVAAPRLAAMALDSSYVDPLAFEPGCEAAAPAVPAAWWCTPRVVGAAAVLALLVVLVVGLTVWRGGDDDLPDPEPLASKVEPSPRVPAVTDRTPTFTAAVAPDPLDDDPAERRRVVEALTDLAERCGVELGPDTPDPDSDSAPAVLIARIAAGLHYNGPWLTDADRSALRADAGYDASLALRWDALVQRFSPDRPLPADFRASPLRRQLSALAWTLHRESDVDAPPDPDMPRRSPAEVAQALAESLAVDLPLRPTPLVERYPTLARYLAFLGRLPRR